LSFSTEVGESEVPIVGAEQQTLEPDAKSTDGLISTSYLAAPGTGFQENFGSNTSGEAFRSVTCGVVDEGQSQLNDATGVATPRLPSASTGVTLQ
jgi:hypothetical protein